MFSNLKIPTRQMINLNEKKKDKLAKHLKCDAKYT